MIQMKYIRYTDGNFNIFPEGVAHNEAVVRDRTPKTAGFISIVGSLENPTDVKVTTYGESTSLGLKASEYDAVMIALALNG